MTGTTPGQSSGRGKRQKGPTRWTQLRDGEEVRWARVLAAQARIATDYYDREDVKAILVDAVLEELSRH